MFARTAVVSIVFLCVIACGSPSTSPDAGTADSGSTGPCSAGDKRCNGVQIEVCNAAGNWQASAACPYACNAGTCVGVCGPGSTQCCEKGADGKASCSGVRLTNCIGGSGCQAGHPLAIVVRTCNAVGEFEETATCGNQCEPSPDQVVVGCGYCNGAAKCLANVSQACSCN